MDHLTKLLCKQGWVRDKVDFGITTDLPRPWLLLGSWKAIVGPVFVTFYELLGFGRIGMMTSVSSDDHLAVLRFAREVEGKLST